MRPARPSAVTRVRSAARFRFGPEVSPLRSSSARAFGEAGFSDVIIIIGGGSTTDADPVRTAAMVGEKVLPELRS